MLLTVVGALAGGQPRLKYDGEPMRDHYPAGCARWPTGPDESEAVGGAAPRTDETVKLDLCIALGGAVPEQMVALVHEELTLSQRMQVLVFRGTAAPLVRRTWVAGPLAATGG